MKKDSKMNVERKTFLVFLILILVSTLCGIIAFTVMEQQTRAALPPQEQRAEIIATVYDGAVCLGCDYGRVIFAMLGTISFVVILFIWGVYELGSRLLTRST